MVSFAMVIWVVMSTRIDRIEDLLISHGQAMVEGAIEKSDPFSISQIVKTANDLRWIILVVVSGAFATQYVTLLLIVRRGLQGRTRLESRLRKSYAQLEELAKLDSLTGLLNRRAIRDLADVEISQAERERTGLGFIILDLDGLKKINDKYGHTVGDQALKQVANTIQETKRAGDWSGRWGGDEFLWILPKVSLGDIIKVSERFQKILDETIVNLPEEKTLTVHVSQGISNVPPHNFGVMTFDELFTEADRALYLSKKKGGNSISHYGEARRADLDSAVIGKRDHLE